MLPHDGDEFFPLGILVAVGSLFLSGKNGVFYQFSPM